MVVKVHKPGAKPVGRKKRTTRPSAPTQDDAGEWGPPKFTKQLQCYLVNYREILKEWAERKHAEVCRPKN